MNNEPVAWIPKGMTLAKPKDLTDCIPLYTHPHPDNLGLAESIIKQQQAEIEALKAKLKLNDETLKPMLIEHIKSSTQRTQQEVFFSKYDSVRKAQEK